MLDALDLAQMTREEKLKAMEALWADLASEEEEVESPTWHEGALRETEARYAEGREPAADWTTAKRELRERFE